MLFESRTEAHRKGTWCKYDFHNFKAVFLKQIKIGKKIICLDVLKYISTDYDCIVVGGYNTLTSIIAMSYMRWHSIPFGINVDGGAVKQNELRIRRIIKKKLLSQASFWLSPSTIADQYLLFYGAKKDSIYRYHFTSLLDSDLEIAKKLTDKKTSIKQELELEEAKIVLSVGRFNLQGGYGKGYDILMQIAEKYRSTDIGFYIVGDEPTEEFMNWKNEKQLHHVHFIGYQDKNSIRKYYASSDLFVLFTRGDVWGLVINEAMSYGLPIITTDRCVAGLELVEDGVNGYIVPINDVNASAERMDDILSRSDLGMLKKNALEIISSYTIEVMAEQHIDIFKELIWKELDSEEAQPR